MSKTPDLTLGRKAIGYPLPEMLNKTSDYCKDLVLEKIKFKLDNSPENQLSCEDLKDLAQALNHLTFV